MKGSRPRVSLAAVHPVLAINLDTSLQTILADIIFLAVVAINALMGFRTGLIRRGVTFVGIYVGLWFATQASHFIAGLLSAHDAIVEAWTYLIIWLIVVFGFEMMGRLLRDRIASTVHIAFDRIAGFIAGLVIGFMEIAVVFLIALALSNINPNTHLIASGYDAPGHAVRDATLSEVVPALQPGLEALLRPGLPQNESLSDFLAEGTQIQTTTH